IELKYAAGYAAALAAALTWSTYSVLSRRVREVPTDAVGAFCGATALLAFIAHLVFEQTYVPQGSEWLALLVLGLGPVGAAFYLWDYGVKRVVGPAGLTVRAERPRLARSTPQGARHGPSR